MGACLEYFQLLGTSLGVNFTEKEAPNFRIDLNPEIGVGFCRHADPIYDNSTFNFLTGLNAARWGEGLWQTGASVGLRYNSNRRVFYNVDLLLKAGALIDEGTLGGAALEPALRIGVGWNALAFETGLVALGGGESLNPGDRYAMLRLAIPFYNMAVAVRNFSEGAPQK